MRSAVVLHMMEKSSDIPGIQQASLAVLQFELHLLGQMGF